jgi:hypothetical protein
VYVLEGNDSNDRRCRLRSVVHTHLCALPGTVRSISARCSTLLGLWRRCLSEQFAVAPSLEMRNLDFEVENNTACALEDVVAKGTSLAKGASIGHEWDAIPRIGVHSLGHSWNGRRRQKVERRSQELEERESKKVRLEPQGNVMVGPRGKG